MQYRIYLRKQCRHLVPWHELHSRYMIPAAVPNHDLIGLRNEVQGHGEGYICPDKIAGMFAVDDRYRLGNSKDFEGWMSLQENIELCVFVGCVRWWR